MPVPAAITQRHKKGKGLIYTPQPDASKKRENSNIYVVTATHHIPTLKGEGLGSQNH